LEDDLMNILRYHELVEADLDIHNPISAVKLRRAIDYLDIKDGDRIVDVGAGRGWLVCELATTRPVHVTALELSHLFAAAAERRLAAAKLVGSVEIVLGPARDYPLNPESFDIALCIGASFALGSFEDALDWLHGAVKPGGRIAIGEPFELRPMPPAVRARWPEYARTLSDIGEGLERRGFELTGMVASSEEDWDHYRSQHWRAAASLLAARPDHPDLEEISARNAGRRALYLAEERAYFGWAIFVAQKLAPKRDGADEVVVVAA
jgi:precorrin-6B methylase 2